MCVGIRPARCLQRASKPSHRAAPAGLVPAHTSRLRLSHATVAPPLRHPHPCLGLARTAGDAAVRGGSQLGGLAAGAGLKPSRVAVVARDEPLRTVVERLSLPGVRRLVVVQRGTGRVEGVVSLSDVAALLFM
jgi:hypothetical protein